MKRETGKSTKQIIEAPKNSIYLCLNPNELRYHKNIAFKHNRIDIRFMTVNSIGRSCERLMGLTNYVIIDHRISPGIDISYKTIEFIQILNHTNKTRKNDI